MGILTVTNTFAGEVGVVPGRVNVVSTDNFATVTTAGYLSPVTSEGYTILATDFIYMVYNFNKQTQVGTMGIFTVSITDGVITLIEYTGEGNVTLPTTAGNIAIFSNTEGTITQNISPAVNGGNIQAGLSGTAGTLASFPATASKGSLVLKGVANTGNTTTTISNAAMGQASVISIPDPAGATANFTVAPAALVSGNVVKASGTAGLVADAGFALHAGTTATFAGGGVTNTFTTTNMTSASIVAPNILTSTNAVSICKAVPGTNTLAITFSADPGAGTTVNWISTTAVA